MFHVRVTIDHATNALGEDRVWEYRREVVSVIPGGPCRNRLPVRVAGRVLEWIDCGRRLPASQECEACRTTAVIVAEVHTRAGQVADPGLVA